MGQDTRFWVEQDERARAQTDRALLAAETARRIEAERERDAARMEASAALSEAARHAAVTDAARNYFTAYREWEREGSLQRGPAAAGKQGAHGSLLAAVLRSFPEVAKP